METPPSGDWGGVEFSLDHKATSREVRRIEETQSLHFAGGTDRMAKSQHAFKGDAGSSWTRALDILSETHRDIMRPLPGFADHVEDSGEQYHGTDGDSASGIGSVM